MQRSGGEQPALFGALLASPEEEVECGPALQHEYSRKLSVSGRLGEDFAQSHYLLEHGGLEAGAGREAEKFPTSRRHGLQTHVEARWGR